MGEKEGLEQQRDESDHDAGEGAEEDGAQAGSGRVGAGAGDRNGDGEAAEDEHRGAEDADQGDVGRVLFFAPVNPDDSPGDDGKGEGKPEDAPPRGQNAFGDMHGEGGARRGQDCQKKGGGERPPGGDSLHVKTPRPESSAR